ncbi:MAG: MFS transporter [Actinomycetota bacterium]|nr:MFS transporter [Actinomycetota bacterium]
MARALSLLGDAVVPVGLAFAVLEINQSASAVGGVLAARTASLVAFLLVGGVLADRLPRKFVLIASDVVRFVAHGLMAVLILTQQAELWHLMVLSFLFGIGWAFFLPTSTGFVPDTVSNDKLQQANALIAATFSGAQILGPVIAGVLVVAVGPGWVLGLDALTFLVSAGFVARVRVTGDINRRVSSLLEDFREGWREFTSRTWLWVDGVYSALTAFVVFPAFFTLGPIISERALGGARAWATIVTAFGIGSVVGGIVLFRFRPRRPLLVGIPPLILLAVPLALLATSRETTFIAVGALGGGFGLTIFNTLFETTVQEHVPAKALSRVASIDWMLSQGLQPLGYAIVGPIAAASGFRSPLLGASVWVLVTTILVLSIPSVRTVERKGMNSDVM